MISLASVGYDDSGVAEHMLWSHLVFQSIWGGVVILAFSSFFNKIPHQEPEILVGIFSPK